MFIEAARFDELEEGRPTSQVVGGRDVILVRWRENVFALRNICPHQSQRFNGGRVHVRLVPGSGPGRPGLAADTPLLQCPMHAWDYDLRTGLCSVDTKVRVRTYATKVEAGRVLIDISARGDSDAANELSSGSR